MSSIVDFGKSLGGKFLFDFYNGNFRFEGDNDPPEYTIYHENMMYPMVPYFEASGDFGPGYANQYAPWYLEQYQNTAFSTKPARTTNEIVNDIFFAIMDDIKDNYVESLLSLDDRLAMRMTEEGEKKLR